MKKKKLVIQKFRKKMYHLKILISKNQLKNIRLLLSDHKDQLLLLTDSQLVKNPLKKTFSELMTAQLKTFRNN